jgi:hypothetical protein
MLEGKIAGIPLVLILLVLVIAVVVDVPVSLMQAVTYKQLNAVIANQNRPVKVTIVAPTEAITPSVVTPTVSVKSVKTATPSGRLR